MPGDAPPAETAAPIPAVVDPADGACGSVEQYFAEGGTLRRLFRLDAVALETLYAYACQRYEAGDHEGARQVFFSLAAIDPHAYDYWLSLGLCLQKLRRHDEAIYCFVRCAGLRMWEPQPPYLAGLSLQLCGDYGKAAEAYEAAIKWCGQQTEHQQLRGLAEQSLRSLLALKSARPMQGEALPNEGGVK
ncbi:SycD/LcrH family type III secretion system chaperone [Cupriavidus gilardii]|uniref:SycD/LcrH family type III secretion system chaperone n=1 Tax=Cupriavidus gilardii TaxID=82541 RepID=UPI001ABDC2ED|nr:SycD/LcrH family type III secretion system chaperone [Cupriavidus gilardii]MBO4123456.1 SycD/LcrH family type III secretion system chaperone [Cupriavidus gilardii]